MAAERSCSGLGREPELPVELAGSYADVIGQDEQAKPGEEEPEQGPTRSERALAPDKHRPKRQAPQREVMAEIRGLLSEP